MRTEIMPRRKNDGSRTCFFAGALLLAAQMLFASGAIAEVGDEARPPEVAAPATLQDAIVGGKAHINIRLRAEFVDQDGLRDAQALTVRTRLGYGTKPYEDFSFYLELEDIRSADYNKYNASGLNSEGNRAVVADPEDTELNQAYIMYARDGLTLIGGRQRLTLDDHRFVGDVGWRQNEQTFDAATAKYAFAENWAFVYSYLWEINRIFGPDSSMDFHSNSHIINVSNDGLPIGKVTAFAYLLDFDNSAANSSDTYGIRIQGKNELSDEYSLGHVASFASQQDSADNPTNYTAEYYLAEASLTRKGLGTVGGGYELLGSDNGVAAFQTPLATGHKFNGWADGFLVTPAGGLEDVYVFAGPKLPAGVKARAVYHWFSADEGGGDLGEELDIVLAKNLGAHISVLIKFAQLNGTSTVVDRRKWWLQCEFKF